MKKVTLTEDEKKTLKEIQETQRQASILGLKAKKLSSDFWFNFQTRMGGGSYQMDLDEGVIWKMSFQESIEASKKEEKK